ncbi:PepSY domain-containing protein [Phenylobacterium sp.]|uniref:PepSY domain-containing protein n=1 Tax=Phenylobacterium sp. TaxID=1871053 RepID=UPI0025DA3085|nr:PepSY domain-containing protein [Phenylobacterium sp.]
MTSSLNVAIFAAASLLATGAMATPKPGSATYAGHELAAGAKLSLAQARAIALKARPGKIVDQELEKESGGSGLRYAFDVKSHATTFEVGVDAMTGKVLENARESPAKEAAEAKAEKVGAKR